MYLPRILSLICILTVSSAYSLPVLASELDDFRAAFPEPMTPLRMSEVKSCSRLQEIMNTRVAILFKKETVTVNFYAVDGILMTVKTRNYRTYDETESECMYDMLLSSGQTYQVGSNSIIEMRYESKGDVLESEFNAKYVNWKHSFSYLVSARDFESSYYQFPSDPTFAILYTTRLGRLKSIEGKIVHQEERRFSDLDGYSYETYSTIESTDPTHEIPQRVVVGAESIKQKRVKPQGLQFIH